MKTGIFVFAVGACIALTHPARARDSACSVVNRDNLIRCALRSSLELESERWDQAAAQGRLTAASSVLPSNPVLSLAAKRWADDDTNRTATNWSASLSQEIEFAGQRGARREAASADIDAQKWRTVAMTREVAAAAWTAYFGVLAAREEEQVALRLEALSAALQRTTRGRADQGIGIPLDADLADIAAVRAMQGRANSQRNRKTAEQTFAVLLGSAPPNVQGELSPVDGVLEFARRVPVAGDPQRPEVNALSAERLAQSARAKAFRRARVPNITLSVFAERDGFAEQVFGVGLALPLPLPHPLGRTNAGEIEEAEALANRASTDAKLKTRDWRSFLTIALMEYESRREELNAFTPERIARAEQALKDIASEIEQGRFTVRDGLVTQQALIELIHAHIDARHALCLASVQLAQAAGFPFEGGVK